MSEREIHLTNESIRLGALECALKFAEFVFNSNAEIKEEFTINSGSILIFAKKFEKYIKTGDTDGS